MQGFRSLSLALTRFINELLQLFHVRQVGGLLGIHFAHDHRDVLLQNVRIQLQPGLPVKIALHRVDVGDGLRLIEQGLPRETDLFGLHADQAKNTTVTVTVNAGGMTVRPYIDYPYWVGISGGVTDGAWVLKASATGTPPAYTITGHSSGSPSRLLDLTKPIKTGGTFVGLASRSMEYGYGWESPLEMRLPKSFENIAGEVFWNDESITNIVFGSSPTISNTAFTHTKQGSVLWQVPANNTNWVAFVSDRTKLIPWNECGATTQALWKLSGKLPVGIAVGYNGPWVRFLPGSGLKLLFK